ncbi:MAG: purine-nucleoside phosphorylase [Planctomycetaceae bacterium]
MTSLFDRVQEATAFLRERGPAPRAWIVLGSGLGSLGERVQGEVRVPYADIPHFPRSTAPGHAGELVLGSLGGVPVAVMQGRFHFYEGYTLSEVTLPVRVAAGLGARALLLTSAVGGMDARLRKGDLVAIEDHVNLMGDSPLRGPNDDRLGSRFPDMSAPYDATLLARAEEIALRLGYRLPRVVLAAVAGPQLETRAEYRFLRALGADVVGMSTVPETIVAAHAGLRVLALSAVTDLCLPDALERVDIAEILRVAADAAPRLERLILELLPHA